MKKLIKISLCLSILLFYRCEKECSPTTFDYWVIDNLTKVNFDFCSNENALTLKKNNNSDKNDFYQFFTNHKKSLLFTSINGDLNTRIDTNKSVLFLPNQISTCNSTSKVGIQVDFFTRSDPNDVRKKNKIESISGQVDKFSLKVNQELVIDSIAINVTSLSSPCVMQFSDNFNGIETKFYIKINRCGKIEHDLFQLHWANIKKLYISRGSLNNNLFKGEIKVLFEDEL